jgi:hypothetical protein
MIIGDMHISQLGLKNVSLFAVFFQNPVVKNFTDPHSCFYQSIHFRTQWGLGVGLGVGPS